MILSICVYICCIVELAISVDRVIEFADFRVVLSCKCRVDCCDVFMVYSVRRKEVVACGCRDRSVGVLVVVLAGVMGASAYR